MKNNKIVFPLLAALALTGCSLFKSNKNNSSSYGSIISENNYDNDPISSITSSGSENGYDGDLPTEDPVEIPEEYDSFTGTEIKNAGKYYLKGDYEKIEITAKKESVVYIFMDGATIYSETGVAFSSSKAITLYLVLLNGSHNIINNDFADSNSFHVKGDVHLSGEGILTVDSAQKNGFKVSKNLYVSGANLTLNVSGANHAITAQSITVNQATINVDSGKDGFQLECDSDVQEFTKEQGFAYFKDANVTADTHGDGIQADTFVYVSGGSMNIVTHGEFVSYSSANIETYGLSTDDFKYVKSGDSYKRVAADEIHSLSSSYYALTCSVKGIKAGAIEVDTNDDDVDDLVVTSGDYDIFIDHLADVTINSTDDCIHTNYGDTHLYNSNFNLTTFDDGAHADKELVVENSSIQISASYEGLEGMNVTINGENTNIVSNSEDDGINAASDLSGTNTITINDGYLRVFANGDGLDANTALYLKGGTVIVEGPGRNNGSLDADTIYFQGGIVFACSSNGMTERMTATQNTFVYQGSSTMSSGSKISIVNSDNNAIFSYTLKQSCNQLIFSHAELQVGSSYRIVSGSTTVSTISMTSSLTKVGNSGGGPGGGPGWH